MPTPRRTPRPARRLATEHKGTATRAKKSRAVAPSPLDDFTRAYLDTALSLSMDTHNRPLVKHYGILDFDPETLETITQDCATFQRQYGDLFDGDEEVAGSDFWYTRNGYLDGFRYSYWPRPDAKILDAAARKAGAYVLKVHRGKIHGMRGV